MSLSLAGGPSYWKITDDSCHNNHFSNVKWMSFGEMGGWWAWGRYKWQWGIKWNWTGNWILGVRKLVIITWAGRIRNEYNIVFVYLCLNAEETENVAVLILLKMWQSSFCAAIVTTTATHPSQNRLQTVNSVTTSSPTHPLPTSLICVLCTPLPDSFVLLQTHGNFASPGLKRTPLAKALSLTVLKSYGMFPLLAFSPSSHAFKTVKDPPLHTIPQLISNSVLFL